MNEPRQLRETTMDPATRNLTGLCRPEFEQTRCSKGTRPTDGPQSRTSVQSFRTAQGNQTDMITTDQLVCMQEALTMRI
jgi:hypothetical protein